MFQKSNIWYLTFHVKYLEIFDLLPPSEPRENLENLGVPGPRFIIIIIFVANFNETSQIDRTRGELLKNMRLAPSGDAPSSSHGGIEVRPTI